MKSLFIISTMIIALTSCKKDETTAYQSHAIVESYLQPNVPVSVKITKELLNGENNTTVQTLNGLNVSITNNGNNYSLTQNANGIYQNTSLNVLAGQTYDLKFTYNNNQITANTTVPAKPINYTASATTLTIPTFGSGGGIPSFPDPLKLTWSNPSSFYHYVLVKSVQANPTEISNSNGRSNFTTSPDQNNNKEINFGQFKYYGKHAMLLYRVLPEYAALYNSSGSSSQNLSNVPTNVTNGLGIFTSINAADTLFVTVN